MTAINEKQSSEAAASAIETPRKVPPDGSVVSGRTPFCQLFGRVSWGRARCGPAGEHAADEFFERCGRSGQRPWPGWLSLGDRLQTAEGALRLEGVAAGVEFCDDSSDARAKISLALLGMPAARRARDNGGSGELGREKFAGSASSASPKSRSFDR